jgi:hypothetical protein
LDSFSDEPLSLGSVESILKPDPAPPQDGNQQRDPTREKRSWAGSSSSAMNTADVAMTSTETASLLGGLQLRGTRIDDKVGLP